jgi:hypothetical protein
MSSRRLLSRILRSLVVFVRRLTIAVGVLIVFLYFAGLKILAALPYAPCSEWPKTSLANARGDIAEVSVRGCCIFGLIKQQYQLRVHPVGSSSAKLVVRFKPKEMPKLNWADDNHLQADLGEVRAISPAIEHVASIRITLNYNGAVPSLD